MIVDGLKKLAHFILIRMRYPLTTLAGLYKDQIIRLHGAPREIVSDRDLRFTSTFWRPLHIKLGTRTKFSIVYHPQIDEQSDQTIQILKDA